MSRGKTDEEKRARQVENKRREPARVPDEVLAATGYGSRTLKRNGESVRGKERRRGGGWRYTDNAHYGPATDAGTHACMQGCERPFSPCFGFSEMHFFPVVAWLARLKTRQLGPRRDGAPLEC